MCPIVLDKVTVNSFETRTYTVEAGVWLQLNVAMYNLNTYFARRP